MAKTEREEFDPETKNIIAHRAGYRCSYPDCNKTLVGPGKLNNEYVTIGEYSHIFSASPGGPRGTGGLSAEQLKRPENGIFLCRNHHKIVDSKQGNKYPPELLIRFKNRHEFLISAEVGEYLFPLNWINSIKIIKSNLFKKEIFIHLGKLTHFYGNPGAGKTTICELLYSCFQQRIDNRWDKEDDYFLFEISMDNPVISKFQVEIINRVITYTVEKNSFPFVSFDFFTIFVKNDMKEENDDINLISKCLNIDRSYLKSFIINDGLKNCITTNKYSIRNIRKIPYPVDEILVDVGNRWQQSFKSCSSSEKGRILLDVSIALANGMSHVKSILLLIDWVNIGTFDNHWFDMYLNYFVSPDCHFQTVLISPDEMNALNWNGWEIAKFENSIPNTIIVQNHL